MQNVLQPLAKSVLVSLRLREAAADAGIHKKFYERKKKFINSIEKMVSIMKIV